MIKTKIICTLGPTSKDKETIKELLIEGMNVARFNFSHETHETHKKIMDTLREASKETGIPVAIMLDTKGPEIRTGKVKDGKIKLEEGKTIKIVEDEIEGTSEKICLSYKKLAEDISPGVHILIADGTLDLEVIDIKEDSTVICKIITGGELGNRKNVNIPGVKVKLPAITNKDRDDIIFGIKEDVDFIAASFIRKPEDVMEIREILKEHNSGIHIISKIESEEGVENINDIIHHSDGIMVARGDLGVQMNAHEVPLIQKKIINLCNQHQKPVVTATQMLDSMINNPRPTRAESSDVANAILDGTDAVMLSGETANGKYPINAVKTMKEIAQITEQSIEFRRAMMLRFESMHSNSRMENALCYSAIQTAHYIDAKAVITPTLSGNTARLLACYRLPQPIIAVTANEKTVKQLLIVSDVFPILTTLADATSQMLTSCIKQAIKAKYISNMDKVVVVAGVPINSRNAINLIRVYIIGNILERGKGINGNKFTGRIVKAKTPVEATSKISGNKEEILMVPYLNKDYSYILEKVNGVIVEEVCDIQKSELKKINPEIVVISELHYSLRLEEGIRVTLDGRQGFIFEGDIDTEEYIERYS